MRNTLLLGAACFVASLLEAQQVRELPPPPPRMTVEGTPGAEYAVAYFERSQAKVKPSVTADLSKAIDDAKLGNLVNLHSVARRSRETAIKKEDDADLVRKAHARAKEDVDKAEKAYDKAPKSRKPPLKRILDKARGNLEDAERIAGRRTDEAKEALEAYDAALDAYLTAREASQPAIEAFKRAAGIP
ncbi:MAG: hypothetical protein ACO3ND_03305 [Opitutales bacterium]